MWQLDSLDAAEVENLAASRGVFIRGDARAALREWAMEKVGDVPLAGFTLSQLQDASSPRITGCHHRLICPNHGMLSPPHLPESLESRRSRESQVAPSGSLVAPNGFLEERQASFSNAASPTPKAGSSSAPLRSVWPTW